MMGFFAFAAVSAMVVLSLVETSVEFLMMNTYFFFTNLSHHQYGLYMLKLS